MAKRRPVQQASQREVIRMVRKPLPPATRVMMDKQRRARRLRIKKVKADAEEMDTQ